MRLHPSTGPNPVLSDENIQRYTKSLYPVALLLILTPLADLGLRAFPPQFGSLQWRYGTVGLLLGSFGTLLLGIGLFGFVAAVCGHRTLLRAMGYATLALGVLTVALFLFFVLDAVQIRQLANANFRTQILKSTIGASFTALVGTATLFVIGRGAVSASRPTSLPGRRVRSAPATLVVASPGAQDAV